MAVITVETTEVAEGSSLPILITFADPDGAVIVPDTIAWTLSDAYGNIINNREQVAIAPSASVKVVLNTSDTAAQTGETALKLQRHFLVEYAYDSTYGNDLTGKGLLIFHIRNIPVLPIVATP